MYCQTDLEEIERGRRDYGAVISLLRGAGSFWHRTSVASLRAILVSGHILPNDGRFPVTYGQSRASYGRQIAAVCLFDFDSAKEDDILLQAWKWGPFVTDQRPATVWIEIPRSRLDSAHLSFALDFHGGNGPYAIATGEEGLTPGLRYGSVLIPYVEAWYCGPIADSTFARYLIFGEPEKSTEHRSVEVGPQALEAIDAIADEWVRRSKERVAAYLAAGGINLAEVMRRADALAKSRRDRKKSG